MNAAVQTYVIGTASRVKIGKSRQPRKRLAALQTGSPEQLSLLLVIDGDHEHHLHGRFAHLRLTGEWFDRTDDIQAFIQEHGGPCQAPAQFIEQERVPQGPSFNEILHERPSPIEPWKWLARAMRKS